MLLVRKNIMYRSDSVLGVNAQGVWKNLIKHVLYSRYFLHVKPNLIVVK